jgi:tellurite resistance protein TerC
MGPQLFPFADYWWFYGLFIAFVLAMLALDLGVFHRKAHVVSLKESAAWTVVWIGLALLFNVGLVLYAHATFATDPRLLAVPGFDPDAAANRVGLEFLTGLLIEKALAVDNIFVFAVVFSYFAIPRASQHRVLFFGILGALVFRAVFIALGAVLLQYHWVVVAAGIFLLATGLKLLFGPERPTDLGQNPVVRFVRRFLPITERLEGERFFVRRGAALLGTPLLVALLVVELSDIIFAIDSVPAIYAVTKEPLVVFTSNIFAILGLRSLYFMLASVIDRFHLLK